MEDINKILNIILYSCIGLFAIFAISFIINLYKIGSIDTKNGANRVKKSITYYILLLFKLPLTILKPFKNFFYYIWPFPQNIFKNDPDESAKKHIGCAWDPYNRLKTIVIILTILMAFITSTIIFRGNESSNKVIFFNKENTYEKILAYVSLAFTAVLGIKSILLYSKNIPAVKKNRDEVQKDLPENASLKTIYETDTKWLFNTSMSYLKIVVASLVLIGGLSASFYFLSQSNDISKIANYILLGFSVLLLLLFIYSYIKDLQIIKILLNNKVFQFIYYGIFLIPCLILEFIDVVYKEIKFTPNTAWYLIAIEMFFIIFYIIGPIISKSLYLNVHKNKDHNLINDQIKGIEKHNIVLSKEIEAIKNNRLELVDKAENKFKVIKENEIKNNKEKFKYNALFWNHVQKNMLYNTDKTQELKDLLENKEELKKFIVNVEDIDNIDQSKFSNIDYINNEIENIQYFSNIIIKKEEKIKNNLIKINQLQRQLINNDGLPKTTSIINNPVPLDKKHLTCGEKWKITIRNKKFIGYDPKGKEIYAVVNEEEGGYNYNFALSKWLFLHSQAPNYYIGKSKKKIIAFKQMSGNNDIKVSYNTQNSNIEINAVDKNKNGEKQARTIEIKNIPHQKWINLVINYNNGILDIFLDGKLVGTGKTNTLKLSKTASLSVGEKHGVRGGLCNFVYFADSLTKQQIINNYEMYKDKRPPTI